MKNKKQSLLIFMGIVCFLMVGMSVIDTFYRSNADSGAIIAHDVEYLKDIFHKIDADCGILDFDQQKNPINFLNVEKFSGSEVGPMNLVHPEKWQGPYAKDNPEIYHVAYQVVSTNKGYFITPGDGVKLPNKKIIGTDIILDKKADIEKMMSDPQALLYKEKPLAARLAIGSSNSNSSLQFFLQDE